MAALPPRRLRISVRSRCRNRFTAALLGLMISLPLAYRRTWKSEKVKSFGEVDDARLVLVEGQPSRCQPVSKSCLDLFGLFPRVAQGDQVIGISDHHRACGHGVTDMGAGQIPHPGGVLHPVQRDVEQQRGNDSSNAMGNFCFEVSLSYRRLERLPRVSSVE
jgi:hypothetical protein